MSNQLNIVMGGLVAPEDYVSWDAHSLPVATVEQTNRAMLCREFGVPDDATDEVLNAAIVPSERDPRLDPRPGDVVEIGKQLFRHVSSRSEKFVCFQSRCGNQWFNSTFRDSLDEWQEVTGDATVVHVEATNAE